LGLRGTKKAVGNCVLRSFMIILLMRIIRVTKRNEMGRTCGTNGMI